jgi:large subunit ribosomal protein L24
MAIKLKIRKGATVEVITGSDKGKRGTVLEVDTDKLKIRVQGVKVQTKHSKQNGLVKSEGFIDYSNVKLVEAAPAQKKAAKKTKAKTA